MSQLARNTALLTAASIGQKAVAFLYFAAIAKTIGDSATGAYFLALGLTTTIGVLDDLGLTSVLIREVARTPEKAIVYTRNIMGLKMLTMPITVLCAFILPGLLGFDAQASTLAFIAVIVMLCDTVSLTFYGALRGLHVLKYESIGIFVGQTITTIIGVFVLLEGATDLRFLILALIAGSLWNACFAVYNVVKRLGIKALAPSYSLGLEPLKMSFMFFLAAIFVKVYSYVDSFTLNMVMGQAAVGVYAVAYKLTYAFQFLPLAFVGALYPAMSAQAGDKVALKKTFLQAEWYVALLAAPVVFGIFAIAPELIHTFYGSDYAESPAVLQILIFVLIFVFLDFPMGSFMNATGNQRIKTGIMGVTMVINVVSNLLLIPVLGIPGAAVSALLCFAFMFTAGFFAVRHIAGVTTFDIILKVGGLFAAGAVMSAVVMILKPFMFWALTIPVGALVFFMVAFLTKAITVNHLKLFRGLISRKSYAPSPASNV
jgi:O-antigen/teichoic acid export membrane protein